MKLISLGLAILQFMVVESFASPTIRVLIGSNKKQVSVSGLDLVKKTAAKEKVYPGKKSFTFNCAPLKKHQDLEMSFFHYISQLYQNLLNHKLIVLKIV